MTVTRAMGDDVEAPAKRTPFGAKRKEDGDDGKKEKKEKKDKKEKKEKRDREDGGGGGERAGTEKDRHEANKRAKKAGDGGDGKGGKDTKEKKDPPEITTLFFGQMPYDTKVEHIVPWLKTILRREGCADEVHAVRLAGGGGTNKKFKGFAFVDFKTQKAAKKARKFHDTLFRGRKVSIEPCSRPEYVTPKSERKKAGAEAGDGDDTKTGDNAKKQLKQLTDSDVVDDMVASACENASPAGVISETDFDSQLRSFLSLLPKDVLAAALAQIEKQAPKAPARRVPYFMGIIKKTSKAHWDRSDAKKKRDAGQMEGDEGQDKDKEKAGDKKTGGSKKPKPAEPVPAKAKDDDYDFAAMHKP